MSRLSAREREVAELVAHGKSNRAIADELSLSERTIESHVSSIFGKLNVCSRVELAAAVLQAAVEVVPPMSPHHVPPNNLPVQVTSFRGRERDVQEVISLLGQQRLVTLSGAAGVGKTRLALQVGADVVNHHPDGVWFANLAAITDSELVSSVVARVLGITQAGEGSVDESIPHWLKRKKLLLILDNCEHVMEAVPAIADAIIRNCLDVRLLATSRQTLDITGEVVYRLPALALPETTTNLKADEAMQYPAIALFVDRAQASDTHFAIGDDNAPTVADLCCRLDGVPLAIELAAARVKVLSISDLVQSLDERFTTLTSGSRTAMPRQKTLRALIDWSYGLLTSPEQTLFNRVSIFAGSFTLKAANSICAGNGIAEAEILDLLASLTDKSLVEANTSGQHARFRLLETTRAYALEKLSAKQERDQLARLHAEYFRDLAQTADERRDEVPEEAWLEDVGPELDNFRGALEWALSQRNDAVLGGAIAGALGLLWMDGGLPAEGRRWVGAALERLDAAEHPDVVALLWLALAPLVYGERCYEIAVRARDLYATLGDGPRVARAWMQMAASLFALGRMGEAADVNERALAACRELNNRRNVAYCLAVKAGISSELGDFDAGRRTYEEALTALRAIGEERGVAVVLMDLADLEFAAGNVTQALAYGRESRDMLLHGRTPLDLALCYANSAAYNIAAGDFDRAHEAGYEGLRWGRKAQSPLHAAFCIQHLAVVGALRGEAQRAAHLKGFVDIVLQEFGIQRGPTEKWSYEKLVASLSEQLNAAELAKLAAEGEAWSEDRAAKEALQI